MLPLPFHQAKVDWFCKRWDRNLRIKAIKNLSKQCSECCFKTCFFFFKWVLWQVQGIVSKRSIPTPLKLSHMLERLLVLLSASYSGGSPFQRKMGGGSKRKRQCSVWRKPPDRGPPYFHLFLRQHCFLAISFLSRETLLLREGASLWDSSCPERELWLCHLWAFQLSLRSDVEASCKGINNLQDWTIEPNVRKAPPF